MIVPAPSVSVTLGGTVSELQPLEMTGTRFPLHGSDELTVTVSDDRFTPFSPLPDPELPLSLPISIDAFATKIAS